MFSVFSVVINIMVLYILNHNGWSSFFCDCVLKVHDGFTVWRFAEGESCCSTPVHPRVWVCWPLRRELWPDEHESQAHTAPQTPQKANACGVPSARWGRLWSHLHRTKRNKVEDEVKWNYRMGKSYFLRWKKNSPLGGFVRTPLVTN